MNILEHLLNEDPVTAISTTSIWGISNHTHITQLLDFNVRLSHTGVKYEFVNAK